MGYSGYREFLCANGHWTSCGVYCDEPKDCWCGAEMTHRNSVDTTNGQDPDYPSSMPARKRKVGSDERIIQEPKYKPVRGSRWRRIKG